MADSALRREHTALHEDIRLLRETVQLTKARVEADSDAADAFRVQVLELVKGTEETEQLLRVNSIRRTVVLAHVRPYCTAPCVSPHPVSHHTLCFTTQCRPFCTTRMP